MYMSVLHVFHMQQTGPYDFTVNLYLKLSLFFLNNSQGLRSIHMIRRLSIAFRNHICRGKITLVHFIASQS